MEPLRSRAKANILPFIAICQLDFDLHCVATPTRVEASIIVFYSVTPVLYGIPVSLSLHYLQIEAAPLLELHILDAPDSVVQGVLFLIRHTDRQGARYELSGEVGLIILLLDSTLELISLHLQNGQTLHLFVIGYEHLGLMNLFALVRLHRHEIDVIGGTMITFDTLYPWYIVIFGFR